MCAADPGPAAAASRGAGSPARGQATVHAGCVLASPQSPTSVFPSPHQVCPQTVRGILQRGRGTAPANLGGTHGKQGMQRSRTIDSRQEGFTSGGTRCLNNLPSPSTSSVCALSTCYVPGSGPDQESFDDNRAFADVLTTRRVKGGWMASGLARPKHILAASFGPTEAQGHSEPGLRVRGSPAGAGGCPVLMSRFGLRETWAAGP